MTISDLPEDLAVEIFSRVPLTSLRALRSTCKNWNALSQNRIFCKAAVEARKQFMGFMMIGSKVCSVKFDFVDLSISIKRVSKFDSQVEIYQVFHCDGLLLCVPTYKNARFLIWNPYLGQTRWILPKNKLDTYDKYAFGYDKNRNHKILRVLCCRDSYNSQNMIISGYEIYDLKSSSWKAFNINDPGWYILCFQLGVSLKGNVYFLTKNKRKRTSDDQLEDIISFDFTRETFGQPLSLPFISQNQDRFVSLSCVREEKLAVLHQSWENGHALEIWVTNPVSVSWIKFMRSVSACKIDNLYGSFLGNFFIDEEKKVVVIFDRDKSCNPRYQTAKIIGQEGYFKSVLLGETPNLHKEMGLTNFQYSRPLVCSSSYVPSLLQLSNL